MMQSLKARITTLVLVSLCAVLLPLVVLSYRFMMEEVDELSDARLAQNARTISALVDDIGGQPPSANGPLAISNWRREHGEHPLTVRGHRYETQIGFQYWSHSNQLLLNSENLANVALDAAPAGFADIPVNGRHWRLFTLLGTNQAWIRVGERYDSRREIARALAVEALAPLLIGLPLLALLVGWSVRRGLHPLIALAARLAERQPQQTDPIGLVDSARELEPVVFALNGLLGRLRAQLQHERQFTANAAHELRTPLAGALVHVENAQAATTPAVAAEALGKAGLGLARLTRIVNQMLELARWDAASTAHEFRAVDLRRCVDEELLELGALVADKDVEIALSSVPAACMIDGWEPGVRTLLRNLLDNAIRYSFAGGRVTITIAPCNDGTRVSIADHGPGIEPARRTAMFERFQRGAEGVSEGSGLGLSIVARIAQLHNARISLEGVDGDAGLRIDVDFLQAANRPGPLSSAVVDHLPS
ncbi:MAG: ATP-binding protein [Dokdonella sp.]